jgi:hypothetical protein
MRQQRKRAARPSVRVKMQMVAVLFLLMAIFLAFSGVDWPMYQHDIMRTGFSNPESINRPPLQNSLLHVAPGQ